jgi:hypothetical protein
VLTEREDWCGCELNAAACCWSCGGWEEEIKLTWRGWEWDITSQSLKQTKAKDSLTQHELKFQKLRGDFLQGTQQRRIARSRIKDGRRKQSGRKNGRVPLAFFLRWKAALARSEFHISWHFWRDPFVFLAKNVAFPCCMRRTEVIRSGSASVSKPKHTHFLPSNPRSRVRACSH